MSNTNQYPMSAAALARNEFPTSDPLHSQTPEVVVSVDPNASRVQNLTMRPTLSSRFGLRLSVVTEKGDHLVFALKEQDLGWLQLGIAECLRDIATKRVEAA